MLLLEDLTAVVLWLLLMVVSLNFVFLCFLLYRRGSRNRYFRKKDAARQRFADTVEAFAQGKIDVREAASRLERAGTHAERDAVQDMLVALIERNTATRVTQLLFELGYVQSWARQVFGPARTRALVASALRGDHPKIDPTRNRAGLWNGLRSLRLLAVPRALAMDHLGRLAGHFAVIFAAEALHDPSALVRQVAVYTMGHIRHPAAIPLLLQEMERAIQAQNDVSLRTTKTTLVCYQLEDLGYFLPFLKHPHWRVRFFVVDSMREIARAAARSRQLSSADFPPGLCDAMLNEASFDKYPDVRARAAALIGYFGEARAIVALRRLMEDENEFVRLHAVRATVSPAYAELVPDLVSRIADQKWRVREAATRSLAEFGRGAIDQLYAVFVQSPDRYASEQIADEIQRLGLTAYILGTLAAPAAADGPLARSVCQKMALLGKTSLLTTAMISPQVPLDARLAIMDSLAVAPTETYLRGLERIARGERGALCDRANALLAQSPGGTAAGAAGGASRA